MDSNLGDRTLAMTLRQAMSANCEITGLEHKLVDQLETQQDHYREEIKRIKELEKGIPRTSNAERKQMMKKRLVMAFKKRDLAGQ